MKADVKAAIEELRQEIDKISMEIELVNASLASVTSPDSEIGRSVESAMQRVCYMENRLDNYKWTFDRISYRDTTEGKVALLAGCDIDRAQRIVDIVRSDCRHDEEESE